MRKPKQINWIFWEVVLDAFFQKKNSRDKKVAKYWNKKNKIVDDLIIRLENFKALMEFKAKYLEGDRNT